MTQNKTKQQTKKQTQKTFLDTKKTNKTYTKKPEPKINMKNWKQGRKQEMQITWKKGETKKNQKMSKKETQKYEQQKQPYLRGKQGFQLKTKKGKQWQKHKKEGLGQSEVALWATSLDP